MSKYEIQVFRSDNGQVYTAIQNDTTGDIEWYDTAGDEVWTGSTHDPDDATFPDYLLPGRISPVPREQWPASTQALIDEIDRSGSRAYFEQADGSVVFLKPNRRVLAICPGIGCTGWAVVEPTENGHKHIASGSVETTPDDCTHGRIAVIVRTIANVIREVQPGRIVLQEPVAIPARGQRTADNVAKSQRLYGAIGFVVHVSGIAFGEPCPQAWRRDCPRDDDQKTAASLFVDRPDDQRAAAISFAKWSTREHVRAAAEMTS